MSTHVEAVARVGKISFINCHPFYHRLFENTPPENVQIYEAYPTKINLAMRKGKVDIAPISSLEYANHPSRYFLFRGPCIGSRDFSGSVLLLSKEKIEYLDGQEIALSRQSLSSATLLRILLRFKYKFRNRFISANDDPNRMLAKAKAVLVIGDDALFYRPEEFVYKYDLSELWWNWTERPFCFAIWAVRQDFAKMYPDSVRAFARDLQENTRRNLSDIEKLIKEGMGISFIDPDFSKIYGYFFNLTFFMDESLREGLELFYRLAYRLGVSPKPKKIRFFE